MNVRVVYCALCGYRDRATKLAEELAARFDAEAEAVEGKFGQFDVFVDDTLVASRGESFLSRMLPKDAPESDSVIAAIEAHWAPRDGEFCELPGTDSE